MSAVEPEPRAPAEDAPNLTMKYMNRFSCIGPACEDTCCAGWRIDVDKAHYERLLMTSKFSAKPLAARMRAAIRVVPPKNKRERERYTLKLHDNGDCVFLDEIGLCEVHKNYGISTLWDVCAFYPRKLKWIGTTLELSATGSCPEVARQLLCHEDGAELEAIDLSRLERHVMQDGLDPRDTRPFFHAYLMLREFMMELFGDATVTLEQKYFLMTWFSKRTNDVLKKHKATGDLGVVEREMALLRSPAVRAEILKRFEQLATPAALVIWIIRAIVRNGRTGTHQDKMRSNWAIMVDEVIGTYSKLASILPEPGADEAAHDASEAKQSPVIEATTAEVWFDYCRRRARLHAVPIAAKAMERYFRNYTIHTWFHKFPTEEEDILHYALRTLVQHAAIRFLIVSHPKMIAALNAYDASAKDAAADAALVVELDKVAVIAFQKIARHTEHGVLLKYFNKMLKGRDMFSLAGAVYLIRF